MTGETGRTIERRAPRPVHWNLPSLPPNYQERPEAVRAVKRQLLGEARAIGVQGMAGIGKTVLATALVRDEEVDAAFPNGIVWLNFGREADAKQKQAELALALTEEPHSFRDPEEGRGQLNQLTETALLLVVLDDVWRIEQFDAFSRLGAHVDGLPRRIRLATGDTVMASIINPGRPTTFVLTHGLACDHRLWDHYVGRLAQAGTVVTWDMPGHGVSPPPADPATALAPAALAAAVCEVVEATTTTPARIVMVGHSLGGLVSLLALRDHPGLHGRVDAAALIATPLTDLGRTMAELGRFGSLRAAGIRASVSWALGNRVTHGLFGHPVNAVPTYGLVRNMGFGPRPQPDQVRRLREALAATPAGIRQAALAGTFGIDLRGTLRHVDIPTLVVVGDCDRIVPPRHSCELLDELRDSALVRFPGAGHAVVVERAGPITSHIRGFVDATTAADTG